MKFGKVEPSEYHLKPLPDDHPILSQLEVHSRGVNLFFGGTQWGMKPWVGTWYASGTKPNGYLSAYAQQFSCIEFNAPHYRTFNAEQYQQWRSQVPSSFRFLPKLPQSISHYRRLNDTTEQVEAFVSGIRSLGNQLGTCFLQMPENFVSDKFQTLEMWLENWPTDLPLSVELRHPSWFDDAELANDLAAMFHSKNIGWVLTDAPGRPDVLHMAACTDKMMIRYGGWDHHPLEETRLEQWAERLDCWSHSGLKEIYFCIHQPDSLRTPETAIALSERLEKKKGHLNVTGIPSRLSLF